MIASESRCALRPDPGGPATRIRRVTPAAALANLVAHYWLVRWELPAGVRCRRESLPDPYAHLAAGDRGSGLWTVRTGRHRHVLKGGGRLLGVRLLPAAVPALLGAPAAAATDRVIGLARIFGTAASGLRAALLGAADDDMVALMDAALRRRLDAPDRAGMAANQILQHIVSAPDVVRVSQVEARFAIGRRTLERIFARYVGVSPKAAIRRQRLIEAADRLSSGERIAGPQLAADLGYFDQAHFINDFRRVVGRTPGAFAGSARR